MRHRACRFSLPARGREPAGRRLRRRPPAAHPGLTKVVSIGRTVDGQDILALKLTRNAQTSRDGSKPSVLYVSNQHAREWITPEMTRRLMHYYLDHYATDRRIKKIVDSTELWFVLSANPDGYDHTFKDADTRLWRKNLRDVDGDGAITVADGADLNRNFAYKRGYDDEGSSPLPTSETYRGPGPESEPETRALDNLEKRIGFTYGINHHSAAELLSLRRPPAGRHADPGRRALHGSRRYPRRSGRSRLPLPGLLGAVHHQR